MFASSLEFYSFQFGRQLLYSAFSPPLYTTGEKQMRVKCVKCGRIGNLTTKKTKSHGTTYEYYYVQHYIKSTGKIEWCYLGRYDSLPLEYKEAIHNNTQHYTQNDRNLNNFESTFISENTEEMLRGRRLAWSRLRASGVRDPGSNPGDPTNQEIKNLTHPESIRDDALYKLFKEIFSRCKKENFS